MIMVYEAFYASSDLPKPMSFAQIVSYVWLGQALLALLPGMPDSEVRAMVRTGAVAYDCAVHRPLQPVVCSLMAWAPPHHSARRAHDHSRHVSCCR